MSLIRNAKFIDTHGIVQFLAECHARSHYARNDIVQVDRAEAKRLVATSISRHGHKNGGGCWVQVVEVNGAICGLMLATLTRVYAIGNKLSASDLFWIVDERASPVDGVKLMRNMVAWAETVPHCIEVKCGTTAVVGDPQIAGRMLQAMGMEEYGAFYRKEFAPRKEEMAA